MPSTFASLQRHAGEFAPPGVEPHHSPDLTLEPKHLDLDVHIDVDRRRVSGTVTHTVIARTEGATELLLHGVDLEIAQVEDPDGHTLSWGYDGRELAIDWADGVPRGAERRVAVTWSVVRPVTGIDFSGPTETTPDRERWAATDHETERARHWLPCLDHLAVRTTLDLRIRSASDLTILANGLLVAREDHGDGTATAVWRLEQPCPAYLLCIAIGDFVRVDGGTVEGREIAAFAPRSYGAEPLERSFGPTAGMMEWMQKRLRTPFPYPKYYQFAVPGIGGAMENISLVSWDDAWVVDARAHAEIGWLVDLINLHEMAHTWFGDVVVCRDYAHAWLKESWATYMESVWLEDTLGTDALHLQLADERRAYFSEADGAYIRPIATRFFDSPWDMYDRHLYPGGAVRLHLLRKEIGDDAFWRGTRAYLARYRGRVVETDDFRRELEAASGRSLARFFDDWFRSPGYPRLEASWSFDADDNEGTLSVKRKDWPKKSNVPRFSLPLTVAVEDGDGVWHRQTVRFDKASTSVRFALTADAQQVVVDPESVLPAKVTLQAGVSQLSRSLSHSPHVRGRLDAASALGKKARRKGLSAIASAYRSEPHWQIRAHYARTLGSAPNAHAAGLLAELLTVETDPKAMSALLDACGQHRDAALADAVAAWIDAGDRPYRAHAAALHALGKQRHVRFEDRLVKATSNDGWWGWVARGAVQGLGALRTERATEVLEALALAPATRRSVRVQAADNLGKAGRWQARAVRERLVDVLSGLTRDPDVGVRKAAAGGLQHLGEASGAGAIEALARVGVPMQDRPRLEKKAQKLRGADPAGRVGALEKSVEELTADLARLRAQLDDVKDRTTNT